MMARLGHRLLEREMFASLRIRPHLILWLAGALGFAAMPMQAVARGYLAYELTGRNAALGGVFLAMGVPMLIFGPAGGVVADRVPKRLILTGAYGLMAVSAVFVTTALLADRLEFWMLVASAAMQGTAFAFMAPARLAFTAELAGREHLVNAITLAQVSMNSTRVIGPSLAGALMGISFLGVESVYVVLTVIMVAAVVMVSRLPEGRPTGEPSGRSPFGDLVDGLGYVRRHPEVGRPVIMSFLVVATAFPYVGFLPSFVDLLGAGPTLLGLMSSAGAVGALLVSLRIAGRGNAELTDRPVAISGVAFGLGVVALGLSPEPITALLVVVVVGGANAGFQSLNNSLVLVRADDEYHGRVQSLLMLGFSGFGIAALPLGAIADAVGLRATLVGMGTAATVSVLGLVLLAHLRPVVDQDAAGSSAVNERTGESEVALPRPAPQG